MKFSHPQIRTAINVQTSYILNETNCNGAIISETDILIPELNSLETKKILKANNSRKIIEEVYITEKGDYLINSILE